MRSISSAFSFCATGKVFSDEFLKKKLQLESVLVPDSHGLSTLFSTGVPLGDEGRRQQADRPLLFLLLSRHFTHGTPGRWRRVTKPKRMVNSVPELLDWNLQLTFQRRNLFREQNDGWAAAKINLMISSKCNHPLFASLQIYTSIFQLLCCIEIILHL